MKELMYKGVLVSEDENGVITIKGLDTVSLKENPNFFQEIIKYLEINKKKSS